MNACHLSAAKYKRDVNTFQLQGYYCHRKKYGYHKMQTTDLEKLEKTKQLLVCETFILLICLTFRLAWCQTRHHPQRGSQIF